MSTEADFPDGAAVLNLDVAWIHGSEAAKYNTEPDIQVHACDRITADDRKLYYTHAGAKTPFQILGPMVPAGWVSPDKSGKFSLGWWSEK